MYVQTVGTRAQVWHGTAKKTSGGLTKNNLMKNKAGRIVSKAKHNTAKREMRLVKYGYGTKKGEFGMVKLGKSRGRKSRRNKSKKMRGGISKPIPQMRGGSGLMALTPADIDAAPMDDIKQFGGVGLHMKKGGSKSMSGPSDVGSSYMIKDVVPQTFSPQDRALQAGGRKKRRGMTGGTGSRALSPADVGDDAVQFRAGNAA